MQTETTKTIGLSKGLQQADQKTTLYRILLLISIVHLFNDTIQAIIPSILPILKNKMELSYMQAGAIIFTLNITASILQPPIGLYSDRKRSPYLLPLGMVLTFIGVLVLALAPSYWMILLSTIFIGIGSAVFHPEASRVAHMAAGKKRGLAQSIFQVGGNFGQSLASLMTILIFVPFGQFGAIWFTVVAGSAIGIQLYISSWYKNRLKLNPPVKKQANTGMSNLNRKRVTLTFVLILFLLFVRTWYHSAISVYYPFQLMERFHLSLTQAQIYIFVYGVAVALGTFFGGPLSDKLGRKNILFFSMVGTAPFAFLLPHATPFWAFVILIFNGFILMSGWSVTVVYAQELVPNMIGTVSGLTTGLSFGLGALGAVALGSLIDAYSLTSILNLVSFLPLIGLLGYFLPSDQRVKEWSSSSSS
ncbi:MFS transporter [Neobacillus pocheonensis]|uniref:MFS transporter n=1 Tax=Neobacillus pocheonensis TaxID=363869 RepID=UPI003D2A6DE1